MSAPWTEPVRPRQMGGARQPCGRAAGYSQFTGLLDSNLHPLELLLLFGHNRSQSKYSGECCCHRGSSPDRLPEE